MNRELSGKGYIKGGEGHLVTVAGGLRRLYRYRDGVLTPEEQEPTKEVIEMDYQGMFELQPVYDAHQSFYGKAFVERWGTENGTRLVLRSYGTVVAQVTPMGEGAAGQEVFGVEIGMKHLSATTLRHVKEFLAQTDDTFRGITLPWLRKAVKDGGPVDGAGSAWRKTYVLNEL